MIAVEEFLSYIQPFEISGRKEEFLEELNKVPDYHEKFASAVENNKDWLELAESTRDEDGYHVFFFLDHSYCSEFEKKRVNTLVLRMFLEGTHPTIKVTVYDKS